MNSTAVNEALGTMKARRFQRAGSDLYGQTRRDELNELRATMFARRRPGDAFSPLNQRELALLESVVNGYEIDQSLLVPLAPCNPDYAVIRHNLLSGEKTVTGTEFRAAADRIIESLMTFAKETVGFPLGTALLLPWRAALAFGKPALAFGIRDFYHLGACRDETTLETRIYFEEIPLVLQGYVAGAKRFGVIVDPMLATGNTVITGIKRLISLNVLPENIIVIAIISAPEGVDNILSQFPGVKIIAGNHDECLNSHGYIVPGLGDFGDLYFDGLNEATVQDWRQQNILSPTAARALTARMTVLAAAEPA